MTHKKECSPVVRVSAFYKTSDENASPDAKANPEYLDMSEYAKTDHLITWRLETLGFVFSNTADKPAIQFTSPNWQETFSNLVVHKGGRFATVHNVNRDGLAFAYLINVVDSATGKVASVDPIVQNDDR